MIRKYTMNISTQDFKFFAANCDMINDVFAHANISQIQKKNYDLGIILNGIIDHPLFDNIITPLYSTVDAANYFVLDVFHDPYPMQTFSKKYRFIFVNIEELYKEKFNYCPDLVDDIFESNGDNNKFIEMKTMPHEQDFHDWFNISLEESLAMDRLFIVSNVTPFYYHSFDPDNTAINQFIRALGNYQGQNLFYISTDGDYFNNVVIYKHAKLFKSNTVLNFNLVGKIGHVYNRPIVFKDQYNINFLGKFLYVAENMKNTSGFSEFILNDISLSLTFVTINITDIMEYVVHTAIRIIEHSKYNILDNTQKEQLGILKKFIVENDYLRIYKYSKFCKKESVNFMRSRLVDRIIPEIDAILEK
ncbi:hypothetical protein QJ856_gp1074 [Tupanvirus deep ocean]|uniref:Uncharacterized protein n=2 Tax=Tupanvirus TaxID=2094720 RepID=A0AC62A7T9_9VIRU|nr:hypothetical protein QJ856_gp1074 [Tupanvirus deep ocean]QKU33683.1 hypothetical protein [Tupanvirus deep ocean]